MCNINPKDKETYLIKPTTFGEMTIRREKNE